MPFTQRCVMASFHVIIHGVLEKKTETSLKLSKELLGAISLNILMSMVAKSFIDIDPMILEIFINFIV